MYVKCTLNGLTYVTYNVCVYIAYTYYIMWHIMCIQYILHSGSSGSVKYSSLSPGTHILRVVAVAANGERAVDRRKIHIGMYIMVSMFCVECKPYVVVDY